MTDEKIKPVAWYDQINKDFSHVERIGWLPLYPESALAQAREEGRIAGLREAAEIYRKLTPEHARIIIEDTDLTWHQCVPQEAVDALKEIAAITRATEGNK
jgi:hypothetical protein